MDIFNIKNNALCLNNPLFYDAECKICFEHHKPGNKLYSFCDCNGSIKWTHLECHNQWIEHLKKKNKEYKKCQICKKKFKKVINPQYKTPQSLSARICHMIS